VNDTLFSKNAYRILVGKCGEVHLVDKEGNRRRKLRLI
jgi:hypothetical protein